MPTLRRQAGERRQVTVGFQVKREEWRERRLQVILLCPSPHQEPSCRTRRKEGDGEGWQEQVANKLAKVEALFPGTANFVIITAADEPQVVFAHPKKTMEEMGEEFVQTCDRLKNAADTFSGTMGEDSCPTLHIRGSSLLFSCYSITEDHYLVFFSEVGDQDYAVTITQDDRMHELCDELRAFIDV